MSSARSELANRLIEQARSLLLEQGLEALTLREIARRAGVSHGAPLRHFRGLSELLAEVAAIGFQVLSEAIEKAGAQLPPGAGPLARLRAGARAYVASAVAEPAMFALMFRPDALDVNNENYLRHGAAAFEHLVRQVRAAQDAGWQSGRDTRVLAGSVWAALHGVATLWAQRALTGPVPAATLDQTIETTLELLLGAQPEA